MGHDERESGSAVVLSLMVRELEPEALALAPSVLAQGLRGGALEQWVLLVMVLVAQEAEEFASEGRWHV